MSFSEVALVVAMATTMLFLVVVIVGLNKKNKSLKKSLEKTAYYQNFYPEQYHKTRDDLMFTLRQLANLKTHCADLNKRLVKLQTREQELKNWLEDSYESV